MRVGKRRPSATRRATLRQIAPISRSRPRTPASRVYRRTSRRSVSSTKANGVVDKPFAASCRGTRNRRAISIFSSSV